MSPSLSVDDLHVRFRTGGDPVHAVNGASFEVASGEIVGLVGESGCGKSVTARSIVGLEEPGEIVGGNIRFDGTELTTADDRTLQHLRARELALVSQDPSTALNPVYTIGEQIAEALRVSRRPDAQSLLRELAVGASSRLRSRKTRTRVLELLETVGIPQPEERIDAYPHQLSGGMCQRVLLAVALAREPSVLIADEPTTGLDTTTQSAILDRLDALTDSTEMGILLISHDFGVVAERCDRVLVMYDGVVVERGSVDSVRSNPTHPYTKALLGSLPGRSEPGTRLPTLEGEPSDRSVPPAGCVFADRCPSATADCRKTNQPVVPVGDEHGVRCGVEEARDASLESMPTSAADPAAGDWRSDERSSADRRQTRTPAADGGALTQRTADGNEAPTAPPTGSEGWIDQPERLDRPAQPMQSDQPVIELEAVTKSFRRSDGLVDRLPWFGSDGQIRAVRGVSLELSAGETLGLVGESGCGKSTLARLITGLEEPTEGTVRLRGDAVGGVDTRTTDQLAEIGTGFQNPGASLNPKRTVGESVAEPLSEAGWADSRRDERVEELLSLVDLSPAFADRYPHRLSGGQRQRVAIARALALEPSVLVLDEPTAALDASTQATVLNLLADLQDELGLSYLFVSHDLDVVRTVADRVATMYLGRFVEVGPATSTLSDPAHPYTQALLDASPRRSAADDSDAVRLVGEPPSPKAPPEGCAFHPRCPAATEECANIDPSLEDAGASRSRCLYAPDWTDDEYEHEQRRQRTNHAETNDR
ncbi:peptide ABC transporter ATPase [Halostagnicola larsenii XH-48]|uniref:Peptide ABC transporter ATPase n=1 Tax=Halostagnicola larsenii XH-48 TaxID=797299 RepID=W0JQV0_9EURY|nr:ABC transporter ATP-binding protein [Halostagnicola larsenii]AHF99549.1 peptide ABC transporter ATPase [Halostagnicola larsenii XH-48]